MCQCPWGSGLYLLALTWRSVSHMVLQNRGKYFCGLFCEAVWISGYVALDGSVIVEWRYWIWLTSWPSLEGKEENIKTTQDRGLSPLQFKSIFSQIRLYRFTVTGIRSDFYCCIVHFDNIKIFSPTNAHFIKHIKCYNLQLKYLCIRSYMFRSIWTILREPMLIFAKVTLL
jgi:hypothetical protein